MKLAIISDTHGHHRQIDKMFPRWLEGVDCVVHTGDLTLTGRLNEIDVFMSWFNDLPVKHLVMIAGNHEFFFERNDYRDKKFAGMMGRANYLQDSGVEIEGLKFWGTPVTPEFNDWAFNRKAGDDIEKHYLLIPDNTDILLTHGPPIGFCDLIFDYKYCKDRHLGCPLLAKHIFRIKPKLSAFGHIHQGQGYLALEETLYVNSSFVTGMSYIPTHSPFWVDTSDWSISKVTRTYTKK